MRNLLKLFFFGFILILGASCVDSSVGEPRTTGAIPDSSAINFNGLWTSNGDSMRFQGTSLKIGADYFNFNFEVIDSNETIVLYKENVSFMTLVEYNKTFFITDEGRIWERF